MRLNIAKVLVFILSFFTVSCFSNQTTKVSNITKKKVPTDAFVKLVVTVDIIECYEEKNLKVSMCKKGSYTSVGSAISIGDLGNSSVLISAGHVCAVDVPQHIKLHKVTINAISTQRQIAEAILINHRVDGMNSIDLCMLLVPGLKTKAVKLASNAPEVGDRVYALSAPAGIFHPPVVPILEGIFSGDVRNGNTSVVTIRATGGSSGSGVLNENMELVGILFATHTHFNSITLINSRVSTIMFIADSMEKLQRAVSAIADPSFK